MGHTYEDVISVENLCLAWEEFLLGKKSKPDVQRFSRDLMDNILSLHEELSTGAYRHGGYHSFFVNDPKRRHIHKASVRDRLLHHAVYRILYPFFDRTFIADSFSCRVGKGMHKAINRFRSLAFQVSRNHTRTCWVLKCDIQKFFASIDHEILLGILGEYIADQNILRLLKNIVESFETSAEGSLPWEWRVRESSGRHLSYDRRETSLCLSPHRGENFLPSPQKGLPLGNLTSQLFSNVYMNVFDQWVKHNLKTKYYVRYADDFVFLSYDKQMLEGIIPRINYFLREHLHLTLHPKKISLKTLASGVDSLGWVHFPDHRILRKTTKRRMFSRIINNPTEEALQSYLGMLTHGNTGKVRNDAMEKYWLYGPD